MYSLGDIRSHIIVGAKVLPLAGDGHRQYYLLLYGEQFEDNDMDYVTYW